MNQVMFTRRPWWTTSDQLVAMLIASYVDSNGTCFPGLRHIGEVTGLQRRQIQRILRGLEADGTIITKENYKDHRQTSNIYEWMLDYGCLANPMRPSRPLAAVPDLFSPEIQEDPLLSVKIKAALETG